MFRIIYDSDIEETLSDDGKTVYVQGNNDTVQGGLGADWISTVLRGEEPDDLSTYLYGGVGNDTLQAALTSDGPNYLDDSGSLTAVLLGGNGSDEIGIVLASVLAPQDITAQGGAGADIITVTSAYPWDDLTEFDYHDTQLTIEGGQGGDTILVELEKNPGGGTIRGGGGNDTMEIKGGYNFVYGDDGNDTITVDSSEAFDWGGGGITWVYGGAGDDVLNLSASAQIGAENHGYGGEGNDTLDLTASGTSDVRNFAYGDGGNDTLELSIFAGGWLDPGTGENQAYGGDGNDTIEARIELRVGGDDGGNEIPPLSGLNLVYGDDGDDDLSAVITVDDSSRLEFARSELYGGEGNDRLSVRGGEGNILTGNQGDDTLIGSAGADRLVGGLGDDLLRGRGGEDVFAFGSIRNGERDRIGDFAIGEDTIDLAYIDANVFRAGNQSFVFGTREGTGRVWVENEEQRSVVYADNGRSILEIALLDGRGVEASDYHASDFLL